MQLRLKINETTFIFMFGKKLETDEGGPDKQ